MKLFRKIPALLLLVLFFSTGVFAASMEGLYSVNNLNELRSTTSNIKNLTTVYVEGHTTAGDGGEGVFNKLSAGGYTDDNGITVIPTGGDGSIAWVREWSGAVNARWYGVTGGESNLSPILQTMVNAFPGRPLYFPAGSYNFLDAVVATSPIEIFGDGRENTKFFFNSTTGNFIAVNTDLPCSFHDFNVDTNVVRSSGAYFIINGSTPATANRATSFYRMRIAKGYDGISFETAYDFRLENLYLVETIRNAVTVQNTVSEDTGDSSIYGCTFDTSNNIGSRAINQLSSGGLRIQNNKFLNHEYQYLGQFVAGDATSVLVIEGNSFEGAGCAWNIKIDEVGGDFSKIGITSNEFNSNGTGGGVQINDINNVVVSNNYGTMGGSAEYWLLIQNGVSHFTSTGNNIAGASSGTGIAVSSDSANGVIGLNNLIGFTTPVVNGSATTVVLAVP